MERYLKGPPLGATLPQTPTRLSDLVGGVYGPGASVASTGMNTLRPAIKAGVARAVGETWEDVLEYYLVSPVLVLLIQYTQFLQSPASSMPIAEKQILPIDWGKSSTKAASITLQAALPPAPKV